ncbi:MAG: NAD(P)H-hydrate dehydratase [Gemmatimonadota bacterium]
MPIPVLSPEQSSTWDRAAEAAGIGLATLMESAGRAVASAICTRYGDRVQQGVIVATGIGNNGGDGWVTARVLHQAGIPVWVAPLHGVGSELERKMAALAHAAGVRQVGPDGPWPNAGLLVDALLGTGARGAPREPVAALVVRLLDLRLPLVAIDGPTGLDLATGVSYLPTRADLSITFGGPRRGHLLARDEIGALLVADIGHPAPSPEWPSLVTDRLAAEWLPRLRAGDHKGSRGRVVVIGGTAGMTGAIRITSRAAFAAGAGLVHAVAPAESIAALIIAEPDLQTLSHELQLPISSELDALLQRADAVVIGPGLGRAAGTAELVLEVLARVRSAVVDADALTVLQGHVKDLRALGAGRSLVLTPHTGEFHTLFPERAHSLEADPWSAASVAADSAGVTVLLKGVPTVVARSGRSVHTIAAGNPGLATGGSGDLLSGLIGAALARGLEPEITAALGAQILGRAADLAARRSSARTLRPMDVISALPDLWRAWDVTRIAPPLARPPFLLELEQPQTY